MSKPYVLDASAILAVLNDEKGGDMVEALLAESAVSVVNLAEVYTKLIDGGLDEQDAKESIALLGLQVRDFDEEQALLSAALRPATKRLGLSFGDRCCLGLAIKIKATAVTAEKSWSKLNVCRTKIIR
ncbi:MAG: type II toxin-antitoxin system VapC family toxin [Acidobacteriota bacterium]